jgi:hypothetical protein
MARRKSGEAVGIGVMNRSVVMDSDCAKIYASLCKEGEAYQKALAVANVAASKMVEALELLNPLAFFDDFNAMEHANKFKAVAYECILAELSQRKEISQEIRLLLKHKAYDPGNPPPSAENLTAFADYARKMEAQTIWKHAQIARP